MESAVLQAGRCAVQWNIVKDCLHIMCFQIVDKIRPFFQTLKEKALVPGTVFEMTATTPDGKSYTANFRLTENDIETIRSLMK